MNYEEDMMLSKVEVDGLSKSSFLLGLLSAFDNRFQASADKFFKEITWKQYFAVISIDLFKEAPTINELADFMGCSHQNVKQILLKLQVKGFIKLFPDKSDKRKLRIQLTKIGKDFLLNNEEKANGIVQKIFKGIDEEHIKTTIQTLMIMEKNIVQITMGK